MSIDFRLDLYASRMSESWNPSDGETPAKAIHEIENTGSTSALLVATGREAEALTADRLYQYVQEQSPVPLNREELDNEEIRKLAIRLAPAFQEAEQLLAVPQEFQRSSSGVAGTDDASDNLDEELEHLGEAEALLRDELQNAYIATSEDEEEDDNTAMAILPSVVSAMATALSVRESSSTTVSSVTRPEADIGKHDLLETPEGISNLRSTSAQKLLPPIRIPSLKSLNLTSSGGTKERDESLLVLVNDYTYKDHAQELQLRIQDESYQVDISKYVVVSSDSSEEGGSFMQEYCVSMTNKHLKQRFIGLVDGKEDILPVRIVRIALRSDVLCGAIMDGINQSIQNVRGTIHKRQGGHLQAYVPSHNNMYTSFQVDVQVCTYKESSPSSNSTKRTGERTLLVRIYHTGTLFPVDEAERPVTEDLPSTDEEILALSDHSLSSIDKVDFSSTIHLREACALIQRLANHESAKKIHVPKEEIGDTDQGVVKYTVKKHLLQHYRGCPSVKAGAITFPALNGDDWPVILSCWRFIANVWNELETRDLTWSTLQNSFFGTFPAQASLDQHYVSQLRRLSRELMIVQLLKSAGDLEKYARESEYACANMIQLLKPAFESYNVEAPPLPTPKALTEYPLEFTPPQNSCPPWGQKVMEALNQIQSDTGKLDQSQPQLLQKINGPESFAAAQRAVSMVLKAFEEQDDEEMNARLQRKNLQVIDRLAKMQEHQKVSIKSLQDSVHVSEKSRKAAEEMESKIGALEVPLTRWSIGVGGASGTCWVTSHHVLFSTQRIPVIGGSSTKVFALADVVFVSTDTSPSLLNPLPTAIRVVQKSTNQEVYKFRPASGGTRLQSFLEIVQACALDPLIAGRT